MDADFLQNNSEQNDYFFGESRACTMCWILHLCSPTKKENNRRARRRSQKTATIMRNSFLCAYCASWWLFFEPPMNTDGRGFFTK
jgi:hypothetical protein